MPENNENKGDIYILHFDRKLHHAQHYVGFTTNVEKRLERHRAGNGSPLVKAFLDNGINFRVAVIVRGVTRNDERSIKNWNNTPRFCPICIKEQEKQLKQLLHG